MSNLQKVLDAKIEDLKTFSDKGLELVQKVSILVQDDKKEEDLTEEDLELLFDISLLNNMITNKTISILEIKYLTEELEEDLNFDEFIKIPNVVEFELKYKTFKESQKFFKVTNGDVIKDLELTKEHFEIFKKETNKIEGAE